MTIPDLRADILALLEERPYGQDELAAVLAVPHGVRRALRALKRAGQVKRVGEKRKWALAGYIAAVGRPVTVPRVVTPKSAVVSPKLEVRSHKAKPKTQASAGPPLRQPTPKSKPDGPLPWWATAPRAGFYALAATHEHRMRDTKEARSLALKINE